MYEYGNGDPSMADDLHGATQGVEGLLDKGKRAANIMRKGSEFINGAQGAQMGAGAAAGGAAGTAGAAAAGGSAAGAGSAATGTAAASGAAGGAAAGGASAGGAAAGGAAGVSGALPVIGVILVVLIIIGALTLLPETVWNPITHVNDGEGLNRFGTTNIQDLSYENTFEEESQVILDEAAKAEGIVSDIFADALTDTREELSAVANGNGWVIDWGESDIPSDEENGIPALYIYCAYSVSMHNLLGEGESLYLDTSGEVQQRGSFFNQDGNAAMEDMKKKLKAILPEAHPSHTYGNCFYGAEMGEPYDVEVEGVPVTHVTVTIYNVDTAAVSARAFGFDLNEPYEEGLSEYTTGELINDMVGFAGSEIFGETFAWAAGGYGYGYDLGFRTYRAANAGAENTDIVDVATQVIGYSYGEPYWSWYGWEYRVEWCAVFVSWAANECGFISDGTIPRFSSCSDGMGHFQRSNQYQSADSNYTPKTGDIVFFDWEGDGLPNHVGIVTGASEGGNTVYTVEGNTSCPSDGREGVWEKTRYKSTILGYGIPLYPGSENAA